jgi:hypothetical protein
MSSINHTFAAFALAVIFVVPGLRAVGSLLLTVSLVDTGYHWSPRLRVSYKQKQ